MPMIDVYAELTGALLRVEGELVADVTQIVARIAGDPSQGGRTGGAPY